MPSWLLARLVFPAAFGCLIVGTVLSLLALPRGFDYGRCVISRLCSSHHNPEGHLFLCLGMVWMSVLLVPVPGWLMRTRPCCPRLGSWGRGMTWLGLAATVLVCLERAWCPTHWSIFESLHLVFAGTAFAGIWFGLAMLAGAMESPPGRPRVRWRWLFRPPWYLAASILPIGVVFAMYLPLNLAAHLNASVFSMGPRPLIWLRTPTFWQWYLVLGLVLGFAMSIRRARRWEQRGKRPVKGWRLDSGGAILGPHRAGWADWDKAAVARGSARASVAG